MVILSDLSPGVHDRRFRTAAMRPFLLFAATHPRPVVQIRAQCRFRDAAHPILRHEPCALQTAKYASYSTERGERLSGAPPVTANIVPAELNALSSPVGTVRAYVTLFYAPTAERVVD